MSERRRTVRYPKTKLAAFKRIIEETSRFPKPITIVVAENKAEEQELPLVGGYYRLPNGEYYPKNLFEKIQQLTLRGGDPIGEAIITAARRGSDHFNITSSSMSLVRSGNSKVAKYMGILSGAIFKVEIKEISELIDIAHKSLDPAEVQRAAELLFSSSLTYTRPLQPSVPPTRDAKEFSPEQIGALHLYFEVINKKLMDSQKSEERLRAIVEKMEQDRKQSEEKFDVAQRALLKCEQAHGGDLDLNRTEEAVPA